MLTSTPYRTVFGRVALPILLLFATQAALAEPAAGETKITGKRPTPCEKSPKDCVAPGGVPSGNNGGQGGNSGTGSTAGGRSGDPIREMDCPELARQIVAWGAKAAAAEKDAADLKGQADAVRRYIAALDSDIQKGAPEIARLSGESERLKRLRMNDCEARPGPRGKGNNALCNNPGAEEAKSLRELKSVLASDADFRRQRSALQLRTQEGDQKVAQASQTAKTFSALVRRAQDERRVKHCPG